MGLDPQQIFAGEFEDFLQGRMAEMGMTCTRDPVLQDCNKPDFLVEHEGRACYVEATHIEGPKEFAEKKGEETLKVSLEESVPEGLRITLEYPSNEVTRLTDPVGREDPGLRDIVQWLRATDLGLGIGERKREFLIKGVRIEVGIYSIPQTLGNRVVWFKSYNEAGSVGKQHEDVWEILRSKYNKYTPNPKSLGDTPLIVALFDESRVPDEMREALYGTRLVSIMFNEESGQALGTRTRNRQDGVWLNSRNGKLEIRHDHLAGVWHFRSMRDPTRPPLLFANPYRQDIESIIPTPMLKQRTRGLSHVQP